MTDLASRIFQGLEEALTHAQSETVAGLQLHIPAQVDVAQVRRRTRGSAVILRNCEQGRKAPD